MGHQVHNMKKPNHIGAGNKRLQRAINGLCSLYYTNQPISKTKLPARIINPIQKEFGDFGQGVYILLGIDHERYTQHLQAQQRAKVGKWCVHTLPQWLNDRLQRGEPCNYEAVKNTHAFTKIIESFGTYKDFVEHCGYDYEEFKLKQNLSTKQGKTLSHLGLEFEYIVDRILTDLGHNFEKHRSPDDTKLKPDYYTFKGKMLGDAKLRLTSKIKYDTKRKYGPYCSRLVVYTLINDLPDLQITNACGFTGVSVYELTNQLPKHLRKRYNKRLAQICDAYHDTITT